MILKYEISDKNGISDKNLEICQIHHKRKKLFSINKLFSLFSIRAWDFESIFYGIYGFYDVKDYFYGICFYFSKGYVKSLRLCIVGIK